MAIIIERFLHFLFIVVAFLRETIFAAIDLLRASQEVSFDVEIREESKEDDCLCDDEIGQENWVVAVIANQKLSRVDENENKLSKLQLGHVSLPPQVLLILWSESSNQIVRVHNDVDK